MSGKVKVSMFLDPALAKAVKVQAARQGSGVSELVRNVFSCAHCGDPITDEFIVGAPKLIAPDKYGVFFHRSRKECLQASGAKIVFLPTCPNCGKPAYQEFDSARLYDRLQKKRVRFYCIQCDNHWFPTPEEASALSRLLAEGP